MIDGEFDLYEKFDAEGNTTEYYSLTVVDIKHDVENLPADHYELEPGRHYPFGDILGVASSRRNITFSDATAEFIDFMSEIERKQAQEQASASRN